MKRILLNLTIVVLALLFLMPVFATITNSFMSQKEIIYRYENLNSSQSNSIDFSFIPNKVTISQYYNLLIDKFDYLNMFWNSMEYSISITLLTILFAIPAAYVFAKINFKFKNLIFFIYIIVMMMPFQVTLLPNYIQLKMLNLLNKKIGLILPAIFSPFGVFLLKQFMTYIPDEYIEEVVLESDSIFHILIYAVIPSVKPGIVSLTVLAFAESWNMVEQPLIFLNDSIKQPLSLALSNIIASTINISFSASVLYLIPIIIIYSYFEENIIEGLSKYKW